MRSRGLLAFCFALIAVGWVASGYLLWRVFLLSDGATVGTDVCSTVFGKSCDRTLLSPTSFQLGFPLAGWGLVYFALLGFLLTLGLTRTSILIAACGLGASVVLAIVLIVNWTDVCYLCLTIHSVNFALLPCLLGLLPTSSEPALVDASESARRSPWRKPALAAAALGALAQATIWWVDDSVAAFFMDRDVVLASYRAQPQAEIPQDDMDARLGPEDAPVQVVIFSSFQCPGCRRAAHHAKRIVETFGDRVSVIYKHFPLSAKCNPKSRGELQPRSCDAAWAAQAAGSQAAFWPYHDVLFERELSAAEDTLQEAARATRLDLEQWQLERQSPAVRSKVQRDIAVGVFLGVQETPAVFFNGRRVRPYSEPVLEFLITQQLNEK
jgi:protein-disulfide isomerase